MEIINFFDCKDHYEARKKEQEYFISLNATLNSIEPMPKPKVIPIVEKKEKEIFECTTCNIRCNSIKFLEEHNKTNKHVNKLHQITTVIQNSANSAPKFICESCNIKCSKKNDWDRHILTRKHLSRVTGYQLVKNITQKVFICKCGKKYVNNSGLWKHSKICHISDSNTLEEETITPHMIDSSISEIKTLTNLVLEIVKSNMELQTQQNELQKQNNEIQKQLFEMCKQNLPSKH